LQKVEKIKTYAQTNRMIIKEQQDADEQLEEKELLSHQ
jgi:hypothetical protein